MDVVNEIVVNKRQGYYPNKTDSRLTQRNLDQYYIFHQV